MRKNPYASDTAEQRVKRQRTSCQDNWIPIVQVAFKNGMWLSLPQDLSWQFVQKRDRGEDVTYTFDWGNKRPGSFVDNGQTTSINR